VVGVPETRYSRAGGVHVAYQVFGEGPFDLLFISHPTDPIDLLWDDPLAAAALRRLGSVARVLMLDLRGAGSSDAVNVAQLPRLEAWVDDIIAVMDAAGSSSAAVLATGESAQPAMVLAAAHPARVHALALVNSCARFVRAPDYPHGAPPEVARKLIDGYREQMGTGQLTEFLTPSRAHDPIFVRWRTRAQRLAGAPATMTPLYDFFLHADVRHVLGLVQAPTLVLHREDDPYVRVAHGRYLATHVSGARFKELPGRDHEWYSGDVDLLVDELVSFLTGVRAAEPSSRHLATVLFTDIVGSTERAAALGDRAWAAALAAHNEIIGGHVAGFRGRLVKLTGDGALAVFDGPARAIHCAEGVRSALETQGLTIRAGVHTGEVEVLGDDVGGIAVHVAARIMALAKPGELLTSGVLPQLVLGSGIQFSDRGSHALKGIEGEWQVAVVMPS